MQVFELSNAISIHVKTILFCKRNAFYRKRKLQTYNCSRIPNCQTSGPNK